MSHPASPVIVSSRSPSPVPPPPPQYSLRFGDFTCEVLDAQKQPFQVYGVKTDERTVECFLEAQDGETFSVRTSYSGKPDQYRLWLHLGEESADRAIMRRDSRWPRIQDKSYTSLTNAKLLMFKKVDTTDDEANSIRAPEDVAKLGRIRLTVDRLLQLERRNAPVITDHLRGPQLPLHERAKKIGSMSAAPGPAVEVGQANWFTCKVDHSFPQIDFIFKCSSRVELQLRGYIAVEYKSSAKRGRAAEDEGGDDADSEEERHLKEQLAKVLERRKARGSEPSISVKREESAPFDNEAGGTSVEDALEVDDSSDSDE